MDRFNAVRLGRQEKRLDADCDRAVEPAFKWFPTRRVLNRSMRTSEWPANTQTAKKIRVIRG
jgi:hypothetical protein